MNSTELVNAIVKGLVAAGMPDGEARTLAPGLAATPQFQGLRSADPHFAIEAARDFGKPIVSERQRQAQAQQAAAEASAARLQAENDAKLSIALSSTSALFEG